MATVQFSHATRRVCGENRTVEVTAERGGGTV